MNTVRAMVVCALCGALAACAKEREIPPPGQAASPGSPNWEIARALSAAPDGIAASASIQEWPDNDTAQVAILRPGSEAWTCFPDKPVTPRSDPICVDDQFMGWIVALRSHWQAPRVTGMGIAYMLQGSAVASETDPFKPQPDSGQAWIDLPPAILIAMPNRSAYAGLPTARPAAGPWVLWARSPYAVIVVPAAAGGTGPASPP